MYDEAIEQNVVVFQTPGLTVFAAPWRYALVSKIDHISSGYSRAYDTPDAVDYLERLIAKRDGQGVRVSELNQWAGEFKCKVPSTATLDDLERLYTASTGKTGGIIRE